METGASAYSREAACSFGPLKAMADELRLLCWPFHNGLRNVGMGSGTMRLEGDETLRAGIRAEGWDVTCEEMEAVDESGPEVGRWRCSPDRAGTRCARPFPATRPPPSGT